MFHSVRDLKRMLVMGVSAASLAAAGLAAIAIQPALAAATGGSGASLPYAEVQAETSATNGTVIGPQWYQGQLADEASMRKAVTLQGTGQQVTFTTPVTTNSINFRYSIPDTSSGSVYTAPLSLYINGTKQADFTLTNAYSWYYGSYPFVNTPGSGNPHHFYDEVHRLFSTTYPAGTTFKLQVDSEDTASSYTIDFADFENVGAALPQPSGSVSVTSEGADSSGVNDSTNAFNAAISAAGAGGTVWIPPGTYNIPGHIAVNNVTIAGAGMWYSTVTGTAPGFYGNSAPNPSSNVHLQNFAIFGNVQERNDSAQVNGIGGAMSNSTVSNIWIEHMKVGAWMDGPMTNLTFSGMRIRDTTADGINLHGGVTNSTITNNDIRNTGDDGIALWADSSIGADSGEMISNNTVQYPMLANGIAVYGGNNNTVTGNLVVDSGITQGGGIHVGQRFTSTPLGTTTISNNTMIRDGSLDPNWQFGVGALWFDGSQGWGGGPVNVSNALIEQSPFEAVQWVEGTISNVNLNNVTIAGTGTFAMQEQTGGTASFTNVTATGVGQATLNNPPSYNCEGGNFVITDNGGNSGISPTQCITASPTPVFPPYPVTGVNTTPSALTFGAQVTGTTSAAQIVSVNNPTNAAASVSSIATSGDFAQTNNCGSSIAANSSCTVNVTFSPTATGTRTGSLTVNAGGVTNTVSLSGTGTAPGPVLSASPAGLSFPSTLVGSTAAAQTVTVTNTGTSAATVSSVTVTGAYTQTNNCTSIAVNGSCTVTVTFKPTAAGANAGTLTVNSNANNNPLTVGLSGNGIGSTTNLALNQPVTASSSTSSSFSPQMAVDGNTSTYWESTDGAGYPQTITVDLGATYPLGSITLALPPSTAWSTRTQTLSVLGSTNNTTFSTIVGSNGYTFNPAVSNNTVTISLPSGTSARYVELSFTANTGWSAAQLAEFEVFPGSGGGGGPVALTASPTSVSFGNQAVGTTSGAQTVTVTNPNSSAVSMTSVGLTGPFAEGNNCGSSLAAGASCQVTVTFTPTATGAASGTLSVNSSAPSSPLTVALSGTGTTTSSEGPYGGTPAGIPGTVKASNYDTGGQGVAYNVSSVNGTGNSYRTDGVDLEACSDTGCGYDLGWTAAGQWFKYTVNVATAGTYTVSFRFASPSGVTDGLHIASSSGTNLSGNVNVPATGGWQTWATATATLTLPAGQQILTVDQDNGGWNLFTMAFTSGTSPTNLALGKTATASSTVQSYVASNTTDGNTSTYWEATNGVWPSAITVNLGAVHSLTSLTVDLPPSTAWSTRTQTLSVLGSTDGTSFTTLVGSATYTWNPSTGNTVSITLPAGTSDQYIELSFTANSVQNGAQVSELELFGP